MYVQIAPPVGEVLFVVRKNARRSISRSQDDHKRPRIGRYRPGPSGITGHRKLPLSREFVVDGDGAGGSRQEFESSPPSVGLRIKPQFTGLRWRLRCM